MSRSRARDQTRFVEDRGPGVRELDVRAVRQGFEKAEEGDLVRGEARGGVGGSADLGYAEAAAGEGCEDEAVDEVLVAGELERGRGG